VKLFSATIMVAVSMGSRPVPMKVFARASPQEGFCLVLKASGDQIVS